MPLFSSKLVESSSAKLWRPDRTHYWQHTAAILIPRKVRQRRVPGRVDWDHGAPSTSSAMMLHGIFNRLHRLQLSAFRARARCFITKFQFASIWDSCSHVCNCFFPLCSIAFGISEADLVSMVLVFFDKQRKKRLQEKQLIILIFYL